MHRKKSRAPGAARTSRGRGSLPRAALVAAALTAISSSTGLIGPVNAAPQPPAQASRGAEGDGTGVERRLEVLVTEVLGNHPQLRVRVVRIEQGVYLLVGGKLGASSEAIPVAARPGARADAPDAAEMRRRLETLRPRIAANLQIPASDVVVIADDLSDAQPEPPRIEKKITEIWDLVFVPRRLKFEGEVRAVAQRATGAEGAPPPARPADDGDDDYKLSHLVSALNFLYKGDAMAPDIVTRWRSQLFIRGTFEQVIRVKRALALIDSPWPQVQLDIWAVQISGSRDRVAEHVETAHEAIRRTRGEMKQVELELEAAIRAYHREHNLLDEATASEVKRVLNFPDPDEDLSLNEALVYLGIADSRGEILADLEERMGDRYGDFRPAGGRFFPSLGSSASQEADAIKADQKTVREFLRAVCRFFEDEGDDERLRAPERLRNATAAVDRLLKQITDAYTSDLQLLYLTPLICKLQSEQLPTSRGAELVGRTRLVVTSGLESLLLPSMESFAEVGSPMPFSRQELMEGADTSGGLATAAPTMLMNALLKGEVEPLFARISPGIAIDVSPQVLPDGGSARLKIIAQFGLSTDEVPSTRPMGVTRRTYADTIKSHLVRTDAAVSVFDLFDISSFSVVTSHPQSPAAIPVLSRLPAIGRIFQLPRQNRRVQHESIILVNNVILPRSLDLARFYLKEGFECPDPDAEGVRTGQGSGHVPAAARVPSTPVRTTRPDM